MTQKIMFTGQRHEPLRHMRIKLPCPSCGFRVGDVSPHVRMSIRPAEEDPLEPADLYIKCGRCKAEIAVQKTE